MIFWVILSNPFTFLQELSAVMAMDMVLSCNKRLFVFAPMLI
jgi:hypothetical protein